MAHLAVADVDRNMSDSAAVVVEEQVAGLDIRQGDLRAASGLRRRIMRKSDTEVAEDRHGET